MVVEGSELLGNFGLVGVPPAPKGALNVNIIFDIGPNGIDNISAKNTATQSLLLAPV
jgi:molecular chaperone DnaK